MPTRTGSGEALVPGRPVDVFAYLADPRNAAEWFASVALDETPSGSVRQGMAWRFVQRGRRGQAVPVRMQVYEFPSRFVWRTQFIWPRTNLVWQMRCEPAEPAEATASSPATRLRFTITIEPGPLGWLTFVLGAWLSPYGLDRRAQGGVDRARELLEARAEVSGRRAGQSGQGAREARGARRKGKPGKPRHASR